ncbi:MAG: bifunctional alpha/beta hydrolase/OsmC family protein [Burkholderiaceae bacterium]
MSVNNRNAGLRIEFPSAQGDKLAARLDLPDITPRGYALFAHCFTCSKDTKGAAYIARALVEQGFGVLRFDFTGLGGSGGEFGNTTFSSNIDDILSAAQWLREHYAAPALMIGHSLGGAATLATADKVPECTAVVTIGAPFDPEHVRLQFEQDLALIEQQGQAQVSIAGRPFTISREFIDDLCGQPQQQRIAGLKRALLILHSAHDGTVNVDNARRIFTVANHPKSFVSLDDADHLLNKEADAQYAAQVISAWASRYLPESRTEAEPVPPELVRTRERGTGRFANTVSTADHTLLADEPVSVGGTNLGLSPYQLLQAALGACTAMTIRMVADRKKIPVERITVDCTHDKVHAFDCSGCEESPVKVDRIERHIEFAGDLDDAQREYLLGIADKCPVHRTLHSGEVQVVTTLRK